MKEQLLEWITKKVETDRLSVVNMHGGALIEQLDIALDECLRDCSDVNKKVKGKREITCKIWFEPGDQDRTMVHFDYDVPSPKLAARDKLVQGGTADLMVDPGKGAYGVERRRQEPGNLFTIAERKAK